MVASAAARTAQKVARHLLGLRHDVALPDDVPPRIDGVLPAHIDSAMRAPDGDRLREGRVPVERVGIQGPDGHGASFLAAACVEQLRAARRARVW